MCSRKVEVKDQTPDIYLFGIFEVRRLSSNLSLIVFKRKTQSKYIPVVTFQSSHFQSAHFQPRATEHLYIFTDSCFSFSKGHTAEEITSGNLICRTFQRCCSPNWNKSHLLFVNMENNHKNVKKMLLFTVHVCGIRTFFIKTIPSLPAEGWT